MSLERDAKQSRTSELLDIAKVVLQALALAIFVRIFLYQPFNIPSGSMEGTLLVGDYLFVSKFSYGYSRYSFPFDIIPFSGRIWEGDPRRGDVAVFRLPSDNSTDFIKRVIGLPGEEIQMQNGVLYIDGTPVPKEPVEDFTYTDGRDKGLRVKRYRETLPNGVQYLVLDKTERGEFDSTDVYVVPEGKYFMMGDNRDNSSDSRASVGFVPKENFIGRADLIFFSAAPEWRFWKVWAWPWTIRWVRFFDVVSRIHIRQ